MTRPTLRPRRLKQRAAPEPIGLLLYDHDDLARRLDGESLTSSGSDEDHAQARRRALWQRLADDERGPWRTLIMADAALIARLAGLDLICPHFSAVTAWFVRTATLAMTSQRPFAIDPCVLLGPPGVGKSFYARKLAEAMGVPRLMVPMANVTDRGAWFSGLSPVWRASGPGRIAQLLLDADTASPVIVLDEIEKMSPINPSETPINVLHSLLERENAQAFQDEFLEIPIRADRVIWIATANTLATLPPSIVDRLITFSISLQPEDRLAIQRSLFAQANAASGNLFAPPSDDLLATLAALNPRAISRLWPIAFGYACEARRNCVTPHDITRAQALLSLQPEPNRIGFLSERDWQDHKPTALKPGKSRDRE